MCDRKTLKLLSLLKEEFKLKALELALDRKVWNSIFSEVVLLFPLHLKEYEM